MASVIVQTQSFLDDAVQRELVQAPSQTDQRDEYKKWPNGVAPGRCLGEMRGAYAFTGGSG